MLQEQKSQLMLDVKKKDSEILSLQQQLVHKDREMQRKKGLDPDGRCRVGWSTVLMGKIPGYSSVFFC